MKKKKRAIEGTLSIMVGGDFKIYSQYETVFQKMGKHVVHMGEGGTGTAAKLVTNFSSAFTPPQQQKRCRMRIR